MSPKIRLSRHGFTTCPSCRAHVRVSRPLADARCFFCSALILGPGDTVAGQSALARVASAGRSGLVAASLLGLGSLGACTTDPKPDKDAAADTSVPDTTADPGDLGSDAGPTGDTGADIGNAPMYGLPADTMEPDASVEDVAGDAAADTAVDSGFAPLYGLPADPDQPEADASEDAAEQDAVDDA